MFKRRARSTLQRIAHGIYPKGGWGRAVSYVLHRLRRLPDAPHKIARGVAAGVFACFTPFFGVHFFIAAGLTYLMKGNVFASIMATFFGNPITFPIIASVSLQMGSWMLGIEHSMPLSGLMGAFGNASVELWFNLMTVFTGEVAHWDNLVRFYKGVFLPYLVGGIVPGIFMSLIMYGISLTLISAYQKRRISRLKKKYEKKRAKVLKKQIKAQKLERGATDGIE